MLFEEKGIIHNMPLLEIICLTIMALSVWKLSDIIVPHVKEKEFMNHYFMVYAMHINISAVITKVFFIICPKSIYMALPNFIITTIATLIIIEICCMLLKKYFSSIYIILSGARD